jgi:beta-xylosidase
MDWEYLDEELGKVYHEKTISSDDKETLDALKIILKQRYPYLKQEGMKKAIEKTFDSLYEPYWVDDFLQRLAVKMYEVPFSKLVRKKKIKKTDL